MASAKGNSIVSRLLPLVEIVALIALLLLFVVKGLIPAWISLRTDFPNYYIVARLLREHYALDRIYDWIWLQRVKDHWSIPQPLVGFVGLMPFSALPLVPFTWLDALEAKRAWLAVNSAVLTGTLFAMQRLTGLEFRRVALIAFLAISPLRNNFLLGQMHIVLLGLLVLAFWLDVRNKWVSCAIVLSVAASLKVYPFFFVVYFLRKRQWKPATVLVVSTVAFVGACFLIFGEPVMRTFFIEQFPRMLRGEATNPFSLTAPTGSSLFHRIFLVQAETNPNPLLQSTSLYSILYPLWQLSLLAATLLIISPRDTEPRRKGLEWAAWICLLLALSTEPASYHRVVLILVAVLAANAIENAWHIGLLLGCYFVVCNAHPAITAQHRVLALLVDFVPYWATVALLVCLLTSLRTRRVDTAGTPVSRQPWQRFRAAWSLATFAAVWAGASATTFVHAKTLNGSQYRIDRTSEAFARFSPHVAGDRLLSVALALDGYRVEDEDGSRLRTSTFGIEDDQLAIASSPNSNRIWIEAVNGGHSRLVELDARPDGAAATPIATIFDGEAPALSPDGRTLVFLRENRGIGRAWLIRLDESGQPLNIPIPISPRGMDTWYVQISASGGILLFAAEHGHLHLFVMRDGTPQRLFAGAHSTAALATGAGTGMVVRQEWNDGYWRLYRSDPSHEGQTQLTSGDCNAYDPAWLDKNRLVYISDCGRGAGMGALAEIDLESTTEAEQRTSADPLRIRRPQGEPQE